MRSGIQAGSPRWVAVAAAILLGMALMPARYGEWVSAVGGLGTRLIAPASHPISMIARWFVPSERRSGGPMLEALRRERDEFRTLWLREQEENARLHQKVQELQQGSLYTDLPLRQLIRPVTGTSSDGGGSMLLVRTGTAEGVEVNAVATTAGVQLVGRIVDARARTSWVRLINDRRVGEKIRGVVMNEDDTRGSQCMLHPIPDGLLQGIVQSGGAEARVGQLVRLDDEEWPRHSQMLVIGRIERVTRTSYGHQLITVRPTVDLERVSEMVLRFTPEPEIADGRGGVR